MNEIEETLGLVLEARDPATGALGYTRRWWRLRCPRPSAALQLRTRITTALGPAAEAAARMVLKLDVDAEESVQVTQDTDEALALQAWRRARSGEALVAEGEKIQDATERLWAVLRIVARYTGVTLDSDALLGVPAPGPGGVHTWTRIGLAHLLLLHADLSFGGGDPHEGCFPPEDDKQAMALADATNKGHPAKFAEALDDILLSADELSLLIAWAILVLYRPF